jgi:esterase/lipase superfamily enzyme
MIRVVILGMLLLAQTLTTACATGATDERRRLIPLHYVTDRMPLEERRLRRVFGRRFAMTRSYGRVTGSIGTSPATLGDPPGWWRTDEAVRKRYFEPAGHDKLDQDRFLASVKAELDRLSELDPNQPRTVILYVHGYNNSFVQAARRTAQFSFDLPVRGVPVLYSWPSRTRVAGYAWDETYAERATPFIRELIEGLIRNVTPDRLHIIVHSMGSRATMAALFELRHEFSDLSRRVTSLTFLAPDLDTILFQRTYAGHLAEMAGRVSLYANRHDRPLAISRKFNGGPALGWHDQHPVVLPGLLTIDTSGVGHSFLRHADFEQEPSIMREIQADLVGIPPAERACLESQSDGSGGTYYRLAPLRRGCPATGPYR